MDFCRIFSLYGSDLYQLFNTSLWDLIIVLIGSFLALRIALFIYRKQEKSVSKRLENEKRHECINRMKCFLLFIKSIIYNSKNQSNAYEDLVGKMIDDPYEIHLVHLKPSNDLRRVSRMDSEGLFSAYTQLFKNDNDFINQYVKLFKCLDFIEVFLQETFVSLERHHGYIHNDRTQVKDLFNELADNVSSVLYSIGFNYDAQYELATKPLNESLITYRNLSRKQASLIEYETFFSQPLREVILNQFRHLSFADILASKCQRASNLLFNIKFNSNGFADQIKASNIELVKAVDELSHMYASMNQKLSNL